MQVDNLLWRKEKCAIDVNAIDKYITCTDQTKHILSCNVQNTGTLLHYPSMIYRKGNNIELSLIANYFIFLKQYLETVGKYSAQVENSIFVTKLIMLKV